jgi:hypothetical protein
MTKAAKKWIREKLAILVYLQFGRCFYCGDPIVLYEDGPIYREVDMATYDHIRPLSKNGRARSPGVASCKLCNELRGDTPFLVFYLRSKEESFLKDVYARKSKHLSRALKEFG